MQALFTWVHLSDLHTGHGDAEHGADQTLVLRELKADLEKLAEWGVPPIDALFVTGDLAFSGGARNPAGAEENSEWADAARWLDEAAASLRLGRDDVYLIPGNHDVPRVAAGQRGLRRLVTALRDGAEPLDEALADEDDKEALLGRMSPFDDFAAAFAAVERRHSLAWAASLSRDHGLRVRLIGLNTALLVNDDRDLGHLRLGKGALAETLRPPGEGEVVLLLSHHPFRWGWMADQRDLASWARRHAHVHLCGHVHAQESWHTVTGGGGSLVTALAGACHEEAGHAPPTHSYNAAAIAVDERGGLWLRVWPRKWSARHKDFRLDVDNVQRSGKTAEHRLGVPLPGWGAAVDVDTAAAQASEGPDEAVPERVPGPGEAACSRMAPASVEEALRPGSGRAAGTQWIHPKSKVSLVWAPPGEFLMGSPEDEEGADDDEHPQHRVRLTEGYWIGRYPVTNKEYGLFLQASPEQGEPEFWSDSRWNQPQQPVVGVSWEDARSFCGWAGLGLPMEAQWEYACRTGEPTRFWCGDEESLLADAGWYEANAESRTHAVGEKLANPWGLHDVHGNVWEWCADGRREYASEPVVDPVGEGGSSRVGRGGSWDGTAWRCRSAFRYWYHPAIRISFLGFRVVLVPRSQ